MVQVGDVVVASTRVDDTGLWGSAKDPVSGVQIWLGGRVAFEEAEWNRAESLPYHGGLACRLLIDLWLAKGADAFPTLLNGAFGVVVHEGGSWHVFTDAMGIYPFYCLKSHSFALGTHPDVLADYSSDLGRPCSRDVTTVAEAIATGSATQPFTLYREIEQLEAASHYHWTREGGTWRSPRKKWWEPWYLAYDPVVDEHVLARELAAALDHAVKVRTLPRLGKSLVMLSGGADSRTALFGAHNPGAVTAFTLCDTPNEETQTAARLARAAGATHVIHRRDMEYYPRSAPDAMRAAAGMWNFADAHYASALDAIHSLGAGVILTGCYADYMFKGLSYNRRYRTLLGKTLPLHDLAPFRREFYHPHVKLSDGYQQLVDQRANQLCAGLDAGQYAIHPDWFADRRIRPLSREADAAGRNTLWRTLPWDPMMADREVIRVFSRMGASTKLNGILFGKAVAVVVGTKARKIRNNNYGAPIDAGEWSRIGWFLWGVAKRKVKRHLAPAAVETCATTGSWPEFGNIIRHSRVIAEFWHSVAGAERAEYREILGMDPWEVSLEQWGRRNPMLFLRIYSRAVWDAGRRQSVNLKIPS